MVYDVVIVGGGVVGSALALALKETKLSILLIDARQEVRPDPRLFALTESSCQLLRNLGVWSALSAYAAPINEVHISRQKRFGSIRLKAQDIQQTSLGYVIPAEQIENALNDKLKQISSFTLRYSAKLKSLQQTQDLVQLQVETPEELLPINAKIVIGADGTDSTVRSQLEIMTDSNDYDQLAIVSKITLAQSQQGVAYERFTADGAIAILPLQSPHSNHIECASIWSVDRSSAASLLKLADAEYLQAIQQAFGQRLGSLQSCGQRHSFPLRLVRAKKTTVDRVFLLGNAAHTMHPIAAQGLNLALYEVALLAEHIIAKCSRGQEISAADLSAVAKMIQNQQQLSIGLSHRLARFFVKPSVLTAFALQLGMIGFDVISPLKKRFIRSMLGQATYTPRLLLSTE